MAFVKQIAFRFQRGKGLIYDIDDLVGEAMLRIVKAQKTFDGRKDCRGFVALHALGAMRDFGRHQNEVQTRYGVSIMRCDVRQADDVPVSFIPLSQWRFLMDSMRALAPRLRRVILLRYFNGQELQEIGDSFGVTDGRISQLHTEAIKRLRRELRMRGVRKLADIL